MRSFTSNSSVPFSDQAAKAFGSSRSSKSMKAEFSESARTAFHSKRSDPPASTASGPFPRAFGGERGPSRSEFSDTATAAFGGGRRHDYSDQASAAFGGAGGSHNFHQAFGKKERRPLVSDYTPPVALTPAERLVAEAKSKTTWGNSALSSAPTTVADALKSEDLFPTLGSAKGSTKATATATAATTATAAATATTETTKAPTMAEKAKLWSQKNDSLKQREAELQKKADLARAIDRRELEILQHIRLHSGRVAPPRAEEEEEEGEEYYEEPEPFQGDEEEEEY